MNWDGIERRKVTEFQEVMSYLDDIKKDVAVLSSKFDGSHKAFREFEVETKKRNDKIDVTLYGNGQIGLTTKVSQIESKNALQAGFMKWWNGVIVTVLIAILGWTIFKK